MADKEAELLAALGEVDERVYENQKEPDLEEASYNAAEAAEAAKLDIDMLAALALPHIFKYLFPPVLKSAWMLLLELIAKPRDFSKLALGIPRGFGKTTIIKLFILYCILFTKKKFILVIAATEGKAEAIIADVFDMLNELNIINLFGDWKFGLEKDTQSVKKFGFKGRSIVVAAMGAGGSIRGVNIKNFRPDVMVFDDIQSKEDAESKVLSDALYSWMLGTAMKAKAQDGCLYIFAGNMYPTEHSILKKLKKNPHWIKFISGGILSDGTSLWEEHRRLEELLDELDSDIESGHPEIFFSEVLNDTEVGINNRIDLNALKPWSWGDDELPQGKVIIIDPAPGNIGGDKVAIGYFEIYDATPGLREVIEESFSPGNTIRSALVLGMRTGTRCIAVEATAYQATLLYWFDFICQQHGIQGFTFIPVHTGMNSKNSRISTMLKSLLAGEILLHPDVRSRVIYQIANWNPMKRYNSDGILDLLAHVPKVVEENGALLQTDITMEMLESNSARVDETLCSI